MSDQGDELSSLSREVLAKARADGPSPEAAAALRRALAPQLGGPGGGSGGSAPRAAPRGALWGGVAGVAALAGIVAWAAWPLAEPVASVPSAPLVVEAASSPSAAAPPASPPTAVEEAATQEVATPQARTEATLDEPAYIEAARRALEGQPGRTLRLARRHHGRFPDGLLGEEAEVLAIEALARLGRHPEAEAEASAFYARHTTSPYRRRIDRALAVTP